jgi:hypothetical protein
MTVADADTAEDLEHGCRDSGIEEERCAQRRDRPPLAEIAPHARRSRGKALRDPEEAEKKSESEWDCHHHEHACDCLRVLPEATQQEAIPGEDPCPALSGALGLEEVLQGFGEGKIDV